MLRKLLRKIRGKNRRLNEDEMKVYLDVLGHPEFMPTRDEIAYTQPSKDDEELDAAITGLMQGGVIVPVGATNPDGGYVTFYGLTEYGAEQAESAVEGLDGLRDDYQRVELTERIRELREYPRPPTREVAGVEIPDKSKL